MNNIRNGKAKRYYNDKLLFEGEYLNGKIWNGTGYDNDNNIIFEIKNGNGHIIISNIYDNKLEFEGEYLNGLRNGKGKEYNYDGKLIFDGEYFNNKKWIYKRVWL